MSLSREALSLLELLPMWQLRPELRAEIHQHESAGKRSVLMVAGLAHSQADRVLWASIANVMRGMGFAAEVIDAALILDTPQSDLWARQALQSRPSHLLAFGQDAAEAVMAAWPPALAARPELSCLPSLADMRGASAAKARAWSALCVLRQTAGQ